MTAAELRWADRWDRWAAARRARRGGRARRRPLSVTAERVLRAAFLALAVGLIVAAALLSFGSLRARAQAAGIIHGPLGLPLLDVTLSAHTLAGVWALTVKAITVIGIIGLRLDPRDRRAWAALLGGLGLDLAFQTYGYDNGIARLQAAVPPLALALAVWIIEVPARGTATGAAGGVGDDGDAGQPLPVTGRVPEPTPPPPGPPSDRPGVAVPAGAQVDRNLPDRNGSRPPVPATIRPQPDRPLAEWSIAQLLPGRGDMQALSRVKDDREAYDRMAARRRIDERAAAEVWRRWHPTPQQEAGRAQPAA
jgi:hypothetical protein